jgi:hypothetical protein
MIRRLLQLRYKISPREDKAFPDAPLGVKSRAISPIELTRVMRFAETCSLLIEDVELLPSTQLLSRKFLLREQSSPGAWNEMTL